MEQINTEHLKHVICAIYIKAHFCLADFLNGCASWGASLDKHSHVALKPTADGSCMDLYINSDFWDKLIVHIKPLFFTLYAGNFSFLYTLAFQAGGVLPVPASVRPFVCASVYLSIKFTLTTQLLDTDLIWNFLICTKHAFWDGGHWPWPSRLAWPFWPRSLGNVLLSAQLLSTDSS